MQMQVGDVAQSADGLCLHAGHIERHPTPGVEEDIVPGDAGTLVPAVDNGVAALEVPAVAAGNSAPASASRAVIVPSKGARSTS